MRIKWTEVAKSSLDAEITFISTKDINGAIKVYALIMNQIQTLSNFPSLGRAGQVQGTRELIINGTPYIVPYRVKNNVLEIICIFHTSRKLPDKW